MCEQNISYSPLLVAGGQSVVMQPTVLQTSRSSRYAPNGEFTQHSGYLPHVFQGPVVKTLYTTATVDRYVSYYLLYTLYTTNTVGTYLLSG